MKQEIEALIGMTIRHTERLLASGDVVWEHAKAGVEKLREQLMSEHPDCAREIDGELTGWLEAQDRQRRH